MEFLTRPFQLAATKRARQTYLQTFLFITISFILLGLAIVSYFIFYYKFIPHIEIEKLVHLQYGDAPHPYGIIPLGSELVSRQAYDISLSLKLPRSPSNLMRGNFMVTLALLPPTHNFVWSYSQRLGISQQISPFTLLKKQDILHLFRRSAIIPYTSLLISLSSRVLTLPFYLLGLRSEIETLNIKIGEGVTFSRGWRNIPNQGILEIQTGQDIQIYEAVILFKARFSGVRWFMYNYRITSFVILTGLFWALTIIFATITWIVLSIYYASNQSSSEKEITLNDTDDIDEKNEEVLTDEDPDLSDTPRTFPTYGTQPPLRFPSRTTDKKESTDNPKNEPDVKAEDEGSYIGSHTKVHGDSGLGTSLSESGGKINVRKRHTSKSED